MKPADLEFRRKLQLTLGFLLIIIGAILGLIPLLQGWLFGVPGIVIVYKNSKESSKINTAIRWLIAKVPKKYQHKIHNLLKHN